MTVYALSIHERGPFKIGHTQNWANRQRTYWDHVSEDLPITHVLLPEASLDVEAELHWYFHEKRSDRHRKVAPPGYRLLAPSNSRRDWFDLVLPDLLLIESLTLLEGWEMVSAIAHWPPKSRL